MNFKFMKYRYTFFGISIALIVISFMLLAVKGLNYGIDFKGGSIIHVRFNDVMTEGKIREFFSNIQKTRNLYFTADQLIVQSVASGMDKEFIIQYPAPPVDSQANAEIHDLILADLKAAHPYSEEALKVSNVGPTVGEEMKKQGIQAALLSVVGILLYLAYRFELQSAVGAIAAIVHDLIIALGFLALIGIEFDITVLAAILTILGYSVNDSIVILDRIRENRKFSKGGNFSELIDESINQTIGRTLNTSITTLLALLSLLWLGGMSIWGFSVALTFGVIIGTYSSIFVSTPVLLEMTGEKPGKK
jgi:preprotein translocase subunit SecF